MPTRNPTQHKTMQVNQQEAEILFSMRRIPQEYRDMVQMQTTVFDEAVQILSRHNQRGNV